MMIFENVIGNINNINAGDIECDYVLIEWYETNKKLLYKKSAEGVEIGIRNNLNVPLKDGDILWMSGNKALVVKIQNCDCIGLKPKSMVEMGKACYEIGNRHSPLFFQDGELLIPFDQPLFNALLKCGFEVYKKCAVLKETLGKGGHTHEHSENN